MVANERRRHMAGGSAAARGREAADRGLGEVPALDNAALVLRALAHPVRVRIVSLLSEGELCVKRLGEMLGFPLSSVSHHLSRLR